MSKEIIQSTVSKYQLKDTAIFAGWISALLIVAAVFWGLTQPVRTRILVRSVNRVLEQSGDSRRLDGMSSHGGTGFFGMGTWFNMTTHQTQRTRSTDREPYFSQGTRAVIFSFVGEGTFFPCAAVLGPDGTVEEFIPLNSHGKRVITRISPGVLATYARRIEGKYYEAAF